MGAGSTDQLIFKLGSIWRRLVHYTSGRLTPRGEPPPVHRTGSWVNFSAGPDAAESTLLYSVF
jgi:hypothetical protein